jgi:hypothetical protein
MGWFTLPRTRVEEPVAASTIFILADEDANTDASAYSRGENINIATAIATRYLLMFALMVSM